MGGKEGGRERSTDRKQMKQTRACLCDGLLLSYKRMHFHNSVIMRQTARCGVAHLSSGTWESDSLWQHSEFCASLSFSARSVSDKIEGNKNRK